MQTTGPNTHEDALDVFRSLLAITDALPEGYKTDEDTPLRDVMPGGWPTVGDLRRLVALCEEAGGRG